MFKRTLNINIEHLVKEIKVECVPGQSIVQEQIDTITRKIVGSLTASIDLFDALNKYAKPGYSGSYHLGVIFEKLFKTANVPSSLRGQIEDAVINALRNSQPEEFNKGSEILFEYDPISQQAIIELRTAIKEFNQAYSKAKNAGVEFIVQEELSSTKTKIPDEILSLRLGKIPEFNFPHRKDDSGASSSQQNTIKSH